MREVILDVRTSARVRETLNFCDPIIAFGKRLRHISDNKVAYNPWLLKNLVQEGLQKETRASLQHT